MISYPINLDEVPNPDKQYLLKFYEGIRIIDISESLIRHPSCPD